MSNRAAFYFANLGADVMRCALAAQSKNDKEYLASLDRAFRTLHLLAKEQRPEALEEGLLLLRALEHARTMGTLRTFIDQVNLVIEPFSARLAPS
ncbi:hypothetical protein HY417_02970 [Candidatus Kaiserbacteria bacterium]|nr:hypothetical protein [Candidatus Kaiserbacteria bacterium]